MNTFNTLTNTHALTEEEKKQFFHKPIALIFGGMGPEAEVSARSALCVAAALRKMSVNFIRIFISAQGDWYLEGDDGLFNVPTYPVRVSGRSGFALLFGLLPSRAGGKSDGGTDTDKTDEASNLEANEKIIEVSLVIPILHGLFGEDGRVQGALDTAGIGYVGVNVAAGAIASDKIYTKIIAESLGIPTLPFVEYNRDYDTVSDVLALAQERLGYPMFIKPCDLGSSLGASAVYSPSDFASGIETAISYGSRRVIIERMLEGKREIECAYLEGEKPVFTHPGEILHSGFYDYKKKYEDESLKASPHAIISEELSSKIKEYAARMVRAVGIHDLCRVDFFVVGDSIYLNEINPIPGFTEGSLYPALMERHGLSDCELISALIRSAMERRT